jgi:hypothetical protein
MIPERRTSNDRMTRNGNCVRGSGRGLFEVLTRYFPGETAENGEKRQAGWQVYCPTFEPRTSRMQAECCRRENLLGSTDNVVT